MKKSNIDQWICEVENLSHITREKLEELQLFRLNELLKRLKDRQGFYCNLPVHLNSLEELQTLPFTTANMISKQSGKFLMTSQSEVSRIISGATSGTTGPSKRVFYTQQDTAHTVTFFAAGISEMVVPGDRVFIAFPFSGPFGLGALIEQAVLSLDAMPIRGGICRTYQEMCEQIAETRPDCYIGFPVPLLSAARFFQACFQPSSHPDAILSGTSGHPSAPGYSAFPIRKALISGDACPASVVRALEQLLGSRLFPHYGSRETGLSGAITCPAHEGMHLKENHVIAEIVDKNLQPVPDGIWGELVITTIGLQAMPLIRYRTGDYARFFKAPCPCGSVTRRLDMVSRIRNSLFSMEELDNLLFSIPEIIDYQAKLEPGGLNIKLYTTTGNCREDAIKLLSESCLTESSKGKENEYLNTCSTEPQHLRQLPIYMEEKKCLPEDSFLYPGKRHIIQT